jgi:hypothetical protein
LYSRKQIEALKHQHQKDIIKVKSDLHAFGFSVSENQRITEKASTSKVGQDDEGFEELIFIKT